MGKAREFSKAFDATNMQHCLWLKRVCEQMDVPDSKMFHDLWTDNPIGVEVQEEDMLQVAECHFVLCMVYTRAALSGQAWMPSPECRV